jgi:hypothetical protein
MKHLKRSLWQLFRHALRQLQGRPRLGDVYADHANGPRRRFHRHAIDEPTIATAIIGDISLRVLNIGYGGIRLETEDNDEIQVLGSAGQMFNLTLCMMGFCYDLRGRLIRTEDSSASFNFEDLTNIDENFLASFLYFMDAGVGLKSLAKHSVSPLYRGPGWLSYGGFSGAIEVHLHLNDEGLAEDAHVFYLHGFNQDFAVYSAKGIAVASKPQREMTVKEKREILMRTISILIGLRQVGQTTRLDSLIASGLKRLQRPQQRGAA